MLDKSASFPEAMRLPTILHLTASPSHGGPERQMLELGCELRDSWRSVYATFQEEGRCGAFVENARREGFDAYSLKYDTPRLLASFREVLSLTRSLQPQVLCPHGYKSNLIGLLVARRLGIPIVSVSHGWTSESLAVRLYEALDRRLVRHMNCVVCVSEGQARKIRRAGVREDKVRVIRDAVRMERFTEVDPAYRKQLELMFPEPPAVIVGAAGRLSPEKGFSVLVDAAAQVLASQHSRAAPPAGNDGVRIGFVLFGDGPLRPALERQIEVRGLNGRFQLAGFRSDLDKLYPHLDLLVLPSFTEGLPNVVLEAYAAGVPVVATAVGGTPEIIDDGINGYLVQPGDAAALASRITDMLSNPVGRREMGLHGQQKIKEQFCFASRAREYEQLLDDLTADTRALTESGCA